jgi:hypothetical protein
MKGAIVAVCIVLFFSALAFTHGNEQHVMGTVTKTKQGRSA